MSRPLTDEERAALLAEVRVAVISVAVIGPRTTSLAVPIWYSYDQIEGVSVITDRTSRKGRAIESAGRFTIVVQHESMPYRYVSVEGPVVSARTVADDELERMARRYFGTGLGRAYAAEFSPDPNMYRYTMQPEIWNSYTEAD